MKQILPFVLIFIFFCCKDEKGNHKESIFADFMVTNIMLSQEFNFPPYYRLTDDKGVSLPVDSIFTKSILVFRFNEHNCENCILAEMALISQSLLSYYFIVRQ